MATEKVSDDNFETEVLKSSTPVVVDFFRADGAVLAGNSARSRGDRRRAQRQGAHHQTEYRRGIGATPSFYNVRAIPTLILFKDGEVAGTSRGYPKNQLTAWINGTVDA